MYKYLILKMHYRITVKLGAVSLEKKWNRWSNGLIWCCTTMVIVRAHFDHETPLTSQNNDGDFNARKIIVYALAAAT